MPNNTLLTRLEELLKRCMSGPWEAKYDLLWSKLGYRIALFYCSTADAQLCAELHDAAPALIAIARAAHDAKDCLACVCDSCEALRSALAAVEE